MSECPRTIKQNHMDDEAKVKSSSNTLLTYSKNGATNPDEQKYRKIRLSNVAFQVDMNPSKFQKSEMGATSKNVRHAYQPGALARGRGHNFGSLGSVKISIGKRTLIGENDAPLAQDVEEMQEIEAALKNVYHAYIQPAALARGRGKSFRSLGSAKINIYKKNMIVEIKNHNSGASKQNKLAHNSNNLMPPDFDTIEDKISFTQEAEMMQEVGATLENVRDTYSQPSALARGPGQNLRSSGSEKRSVGKRNLVGESKNHNSTASEQNKLAHNSSNLMPPSVDSMEDDVSLAQEDEIMQAKKVRGKNKNKDVVGLKPGEKFRVNFYHNRVVGKHQTSFSRHLGILVRDRNMCPLQVHSWKDIREDKLEHMWRAVTETSIRNSINRSKLKMPHRTDNKPIREIIYELGDKDGNPPNMATIFFETHKKDDTLVEPKASKKYAEIQEPIQSEPSLTNIEVVERCFGPQNKSHVFGLGGDITTKELKGGSSSKVAILMELNATRKEKESLQTELNATKKAKESLEKHMDDFESKYDHLISLLVGQPSSSSPSSSQQSTG